MKNIFPTLSSQAVLSPMAGVTDIAFRTLAKKYGAGMTYTEFVSSTGLVRGNKNTKKMIQTDESEKPVAVQLFGTSVDDTIQAGLIAQDSFDVIDVNCGCPAWKVIKSGAGSEMLKNPKQIGFFVQKLVESLDKPVTVKIRAGIDDTSINAVEVAKIIEQAGASAIAIHGRTQKQGYSGKSDWNIIKQVKQAVSIPVIGNGDVFTPEAFVEKLSYSGVDAIMIARGAIGNPYIFQQIQDYMKTGTYKQKKPIPLFLEYLALAKKYNISFSVIKTHAMQFTKGMDGGSKIRENISKIKTLSELEMYCNSLS